MTLALVRLLWRPAVPLWLAFAALLAFNAWDEGQPALLVLVVPAALGFVSGQAVKEVLHGWFSWTLPDLRRKLAGSSALMAVFASVAGAWLYRLAGGTLDEALAFFLGLLPFGLAFALNRVTLVALVAAGFALAPLLGWALSWPWATMALGAGGAALGIYGVLSARQARARPFSTPVLLGLGMDADKRWMQAWALRKRRTRSWQLPDSPDLWDWVRAGAYEHFGHHRAGWFGSSSALALAGVGMTLWVGLTASEPRAQDPFGVAMLGLAGALYVTLNGWTLRWGWVYPLTRAQRAEVTYRASLLYGLGFLAVMAPVVFASKALLGWLVASHPLQVSNGLLAFALLLTAALLPPLQWVRLRYLAHCDAGAQKAFIVMGSVVAFGATLSVALTFYARTPLGQAPWLVLPGVLALAALTQLWLRWRLRRFFRNGDLI